MQAKGDSPEHHEERARTYAAFKNWDVVEIYHLEGVSGKTVINHPEAKRMMADVKRGHISGLIFSKVDRFVRYTKELLEFAEFFEKHNADLISIEQAIDPSTPFGKLNLTYMGALSEWERGEISARVSASIPIRAKLGKPLGGQAPFGYAWEEKKLVINEDEASIRRHMYDLFLEHKRKRTVARLLNEQGYRTRKGATFSDTTITRLLLDPIAKGIRLANYTTQKGGKKKIKSEDDWVYNKVPMIITEEKWDQVQAILHHIAKNNTKPLKTNLHLFTGFARCYCGELMYVLSKTNKYVCRGCKHKIQADDLEDIFKEQLEHFAISETSAEEVLAIGSKRNREYEHLLKTTEKEIADLKKRIETLFELHENGQLETEDFSKHYSEPKERLDTLILQKNELSEQMQSFTHESTTVTQTLGILQNVYGTWNDLSKQAKRDIIQTMTKSIIIGKEEIDINLKTLNPFSLEPITFGQHNDKGSLQQPT